MAIGIFRKLSDRVKSIWDSVKEYLPVITKLAAPIVQQALPQVAPFVPIVQQGIETLVGPSKLSPSNPLNKLAESINSTTSPFIKFNKSI